MKKAESKRSNLTKIIYSYFIDFCHELAIFKECQITGNQYYDQVGVTVEATKMQTEKEVNVDEFLSRTK